MRRIVPSTLVLVLIAAVLGSCGERPRGRLGPAAHGGPAPLPPQNTLAARQCLARLGNEAQAIYTALPDQSFGEGCATINTVRLSRLRTDQATLGLVNLGPVACDLANEFAGWARFGVDRAARQILGSPVIRIETMGSYSCRNVAGQARRSAHATAQAIDFSAVVLADGRRVSVLGDWSGTDPAAREFLRVIHESACKRFGTTLGPDYNAAHRNHLHLEVTGGRFCR